MKGVFDTLLNAFRVPDLRKKLFFSFFILFVYQIGGFIPVPGINRVLFTELIQNMGQIGNLLDIMSGGGLYAATIFAMGISPYINSSIIMQLLTVAIPYLERLSKDGEGGRKKIQKITRWVTIGLALLQSSIFWWNTRSAMSGFLPAPINAALIILSFTAGTAFVMWLGEQINVKGIGNGISMIIFAGIVTRLPRMALQLFNYSQDVSGRFESAFVGIILGVLLFVAISSVALATIIFVVFVQNAERRIPVQYSKRVIGRKTYGGQNTYVPIKVNQSGVMPVIFATSILALPSTIVSLLFSNSTNVVVQWFRDFGKSPFYYVFYFVFIIGFTFFYSLIQFNPIEISNNLQKNGGFIPGVRPGRPTSDFIAKTASRMNWVDAFFLALVCLIPTLIGTITGMPDVWFAGTSVLILTGVANDMVKQIESQLVTHHYRGFLD